MTDSVKAALITGAASLVVGVLATLAIIWKTNTELRKAAVESQELKARADDLRQLIDNTVMDIGWKKVDNNNDPFDTNCEYAVVPTQTSWDHYQNRFYATHVSPTMVVGVYERGTPGLAVAVDSNNKTVARAGGDNQLHEKSVQVNKRCRKWVN